MNGYGTAAGLRSRKQRRKQKVRRLKSKRSKSMQKAKDAKDNLAKEVVLALDYLLHEGFICLIDQKEPRIVLSREANT